MCFAPQRRALFRHRNFQKWSGPGVLCTFSLGNVLRATTACTFSTSQLPKVVRSWCVLYILTWKCASRHNGVQFFISHLASWLRTRRFSEPTFRPSGATNHWKNTVNRDFPTFSRICIFFLLIFSLLTLLTSAFQLSILSEVSLLNFLRINGYNCEYTLFSDKPIWDIKCPQQLDLNSWPSWMSRRATKIMVTDPKIHHSACFGHEFLMGKPGNLNGSGLQISRNTTISQSKC